MKTSLRSLVFTSFGHFSNDSVYLIYPLLITYYALIPGLNLVLLGSLAIVYQLIYGALSTPIGMLTDKTGNEGLMITVGIAILGIGMGAFALSFAYVGTRLLFITLGVLLLGSGTAFYHPLGASILKSTYKEKAAAVMGINGSFGSLGRSVMPIILVFLITALGASIALGLVAIELVAAAAILYVGLMPFNRSIGKNAAMHGKSQNVQAKKSMRKKAKTKSEGIFKSGYGRILLPLVAVIFVRAMFLTGTTTFVPEYLKTMIHSEILVGTILSISFFFAIFGQLAFGYLTTKKGGRFTITVTTFISAITFALFLYAGSNAYLVLLIYSIFVFATFNGFAVILGYVNQLVPDRIANSSNAFTWGIGQIFGSAAGLAVMTFMLEYISVKNAMWYMFGFLILAIIMLPILYIGHNKKRKNGNGINNAFHNA
ncbi:MAG: MFS transporter [Methanothrix sp.]